MRPRTITGNQQQLGLSINLRLAYVRLNEEIKQGKKQECIHYPFVCHVLEYSSGVQSSTLIKYVFKSNLCWELGLPTTRFGKQLENKWEIFARLLQRCDMG